MCDCAVAQVVLHWLLTTDLQVQVISRGIHGRSGTNTYFHQFLLFPPADHHSTIALGSTSQHISHPQCFSLCLYLWPDI